LIFDPKDLLAHPAPSLRRTASALREAVFRL
jgi:hypothetical protein